jgi:hypothetical protein
MTEYVNKNRLESHEKGTVQVETDETRSFYRDKKRQIGLWRAINQERGEGKSFLVWEEGT